ncbi:3-isopropylmalate dehydratase large subunit [Candidatus Leptofilum sp.]|uniref:3-isopropylmalate dehydratase large subunit n=1 Tax=Candidatus Leptofilum sp. TaxID=3241576 RepID=UPI003B597BF9
MSQTIAEKIISQHAGTTVRAGDIAIVPVDGAMATDATAPLAIQAFREMGGTRLWDAANFSLVLDHATPAPNERVANLHELIRAFARETGCMLYDVGEGICHQLMVENGHVKPHDIFIGADSHTLTYGALGAFAAGMGSTDLAAIMLTGQTWLKVPRSIKIVLNGRLPTGVVAKDVILYLVGRLGISGATYEAVEFMGTAVHNLSLASRMTLANMVAEMGAKAGLVDTMGLQLPYEFESVKPESDASYRAIYEYDVSTLRPQIALPHSPDKVVDIDEAVGQKVSMAFIGSCTNGRLEDWQEAARVLEGQKLAPGVRLIMAPASRAVFNAALRDGTAAILSAAGATFITSGCGPCVGTHQGIPGNDEVVISSTNRNFRGRMGNPNSQVYLASPAVVAATAVAGEIIDPKEVGIVRRT